MKKICMGIVALFITLGLSAREISINIADGVSLTIVTCPAGSFMMGSPANESGHQKNETQHQVTITKPFAIGKYEVTQAQYQALMRQNPSKVKGDDHPVEKVSYSDAMAFCEKLNILMKEKLPEGYKFSLPTEAQWEYACRAGSTGAYAGEIKEIGWFSDNSEDHHHAVGQKQPNAWGIHDMHGNVWEWCLDWAGDYTGDVADPQGLSTGEQRICRGGCFEKKAKKCRSAYRETSTPRRSNPTLGFRIAIVPVQ